MSTRTSGLRIMFRDLSRAVWVMYLAAAGKYLRLTRQPS